MIIKAAKFGELLVSRPAGREAYLTAKAYLIGKKENTLKLDFSGVKVLTPSWIDEFTGTLKQDYPKIKLSFSNPEKNQTVASALKMLLT